MGKQRKSITVKLVSTAGTGYYHTTARNPRIDSLTGIKKYDPRAVNPATGKRGLHVEFKEVKKLK